MPQLQLHGLPQLVLDDGRAIVLAAREAALLAWLHLEGPTPRAALAGRLWPGGGEAKARVNLRQLLARLRRHGGALLAETDGRLALAAPVTVRDAGTAHLLGALEFDDAPELAEWLDARRAADRRERVHQLLVGCRHALDRNDLDAALGAVNQALALEATLEEAHRLRMDTLYRRGDRAAAIAAWDDCRLALRQAFGIAPSAATNEFGQWLLAQEHAPQPAASGALPAQLRQPPLLAGRDALLASIAQALALGRSVVLTGPGGIGKSRLVRELAGQRPGFLVVSAFLGDALEVGALLRRLLQSVLSAFAPPLDATLAADVQRLSGERPAPGLRSPTEHRRALESAFAALDACTARGWRGLVVEDLHHADSASLDILQAWFGRWLQREIDEGPQLLLSARREELAPAGTALLDGVIGHTRVLHHDVPALDAAGARELLAALPRAPAWSDDAALDALARALHDSVGGNPAFLLEALRHLWLEGRDSWKPGAPLRAPPTLLDSVAGRLGRLPAEALQVAQLAAIAQSDFEPSLASQASGKSLLELAPVLAWLESAQIFCGGRLSHDLIARAARETVPQALLGPLHRLVAEHLMAQPGREARVAHHLDAAGDTRQAAGWHRRAGDRARALWQPAQAAACYERAAAAFDAGQERAQALGAWLDAARFWLWVRRLDEARRALDAALPLAVQPEERVMWLARESAWRFSARDLAGSTAVVQTLIPLLRDGLARLPMAELGHALRVVCVAIQNGGPQEDALALCEAARERVLTADADDAAAWAQAYGGALHWLGRPLDASRVLDQAWQRMDERCDPAARVSVLDQRVRVQHSLGDLASATEGGRSLLHLAEQSQAGVVFECDVLHVTGTMLAARGQVAQALASFDEVRRRLAAADLPMRETFAVSFVHAAVAAGRHDAAREALAGIARGVDEPLNPMHDHARAWAHARLAQACGESADAWTARLRALPPLAPGPELLRQVHLALLEAPDAAMLSALREAVALRGYRSLERALCLAAAQQAARDRRRTAALALVDRALALAHCVDAWTEQVATVWLVAGEVLAACGEDGRAQAVWRQGAQWVDDGARQWHGPRERHAWLVGNRVHAALTRLGMPAVRLHAVGPAPTGAR